MQKKMKNIFYFLCLLILFFYSACNNKSGESKLQQDSISGDLIIFNAGSLSVPMKEITDSFKILHPQVNILSEAAGSKACARKITDLQKPCDVLASADYNVIEQLLIPNYADWCIKFASNEMCIVFTEKSKFANEINQNNWFDILQKKEVLFSRSDPNADPCGVRAVLTIKLAESFYKKKNLAENMLKKDLNYMRPKETDLLSLLESNTLDYIFLYRSVAEQHKLRYLILPDSINMKKSEFAEFYKTATVETVGKTPTEKIVEKGEAMVYGITIPKNSPNYKTALAFVQFLLSEKGMSIMQKNGQPSVVPSSTSTFLEIPELLKPYAKE
jgi:molybdate/tungstate transport system substrate-binding protein